MQKEFEMLITKLSHMKRKSLKPLPHAEERALWRAQREAGTNEVWQCKWSTCNWDDYPTHLEPLWLPDAQYRPKPKPAKLTAKIVINKPMAFTEYEARIQDWEFYGTPEGYRVECEKYGYAVVSEIKKVVEKPKTLKYYFALVKDRAGCISVEWTDEANISTLRGLNNGWSGHTIIGNIEERDVPIE